ncbi:MAG: DUF192 domain-containing protein [Nitrososphaerota archaeon]
MRKEKIIVSSELNDYVFDAYIVETEDEAVTGLSGLDDIDRFTCMVFTIPFNSNKENLCIFNTNKMKFNIDIAELNEDQEITKIHHNVPPGIAAIPVINAHYVIEFKGNTCNKLSIEEGDKVFTDDVEHRRAVGAHSYIELHKTAEFEGIDAETPDYDNNLIYLDKTIRESKPYKNISRLSIIENLFNSHENFDIHSNEPEPRSTN